MNKPSGHDFQDDPLACLITPVAAFSDALLEAYGAEVDACELELFLDARALHAAVWWSWFAQLDRRRAERAGFWLDWWRERLT